MQATDLIDALSRVVSIFPGADVKLSGNSLIVNDEQGKVDLRTGVVVVKEDVGRSGIGVPSGFENRGG